MTRSDRICVGQITGAHGVRGLVKLHAFTGDPGAVTAYGPLSDEAGEHVYRIELLNMLKGQWLARIEGVDDRNAAEALRGRRLYVGREQLPETGEDEFYYADLAGLAVRTRDGEPIGEVAAVHDFGAGDVIEVRAADGKRHYVPFTKAVVPVVDIAGRLLVVDPPAGLLDDAGEDRGEAEDDGLENNGPESDGPESDGTEKAR